MAASIVHHFSEDPSIARFEPHVPKTNPNQRPAVWAIDPEHAPLYWFPRNCPRVTAWPRDLDERVEFCRRLATSAHRLHAIETSWLDRVRTTQLFRYDFDATDFAPWPDASGQWISHEVVEPVAVTAMGGLVDAHREARIELRLVPNLWPLVELVKDGQWDFSCVRLVHAVPPDIATQWSAIRPRGLTVIAVDPASASLDVARARPGAQRVTWRLGDATTHSTLRFRDRDEITASLTSSGFTIDEIRDAPDRPRREFVFIARPTHE